jgi:glycosyltransferase involved in cell wall biosynthesis
MKSKYSKFSNIDIIDPIYDIESLSALRSSCSLYLHGHSAGGTNPSLVEMMHFEKDILAFDCNYNRATTEGKCDYFFNVEELVFKVGGQESIKNGTDMLEIAQRRYTWKIVKQQYFNLFK